MEEEDEWITVRRRKRGSGHAAAKLKMLPIPVVPLSFAALAEPDEPRATENKDGKKRRSRGKAPKEAHDGDDDDDSADKPAAQPPAAAPARQAGGAAVGAQAASGRATTKRESLLAWLLRHLMALLVWMGLASAPGGRRKRKPRSSASASAAAAAPAAAAVSTAAAPTAARGKAAATEPTSTDAPAAKPALASASAAQQASGAAKAKPQPPASSTPAAAANEAQQKQQQKQQPVAQAPAPAPAGKAQNAAAPTRAAEPADTQTPSAKAPAATPPAAAVPAPAAPAPTAAPAPQLRAPQPAQQAPRAPPPPSGPRCDADWGRGKLVLRSLASAHADVVAAVALEGEVAVTAGYDGAIKVWRWPLAAGGGGGASPRPAPALVRTLVGHTGRVEALALDGATGRVASSGRDSSLKVWELGAEADGSAAHELASTYVYESIRSLAADWAGSSAGGGGGGGNGRVLLGSRSGAVLLYGLGAGGGARKTATLRGHEDEVTALHFHGADAALSGSRDGTVRLWDLRAASGGATAVLGGISGRVCSLAVAGPGGQQLVAGDCSSSLKIWDLRMLPAAPRARAPAPQRLANAPAFAGDACPTAGLWHGPRAGVLVSSGVAWWTSNTQALEEAPASAKLPMACLNMHAVGPCDGSGVPGLPARYLYTVRLGAGVVTCMAGAADEASLLVGGATGALWALSLVRGSSAAVAAAERAAAADEGAALLDGLVLGVEELSDDEYEDEQEVD